MQLLDLTLPTPEENLALDEALLVEGSGETLRFWESPSPVVVLGRSSRVEEEVDLEACRRLGAPVLRRASGGATIVTGPGCLMYALVLDLERRETLRAIDRAHAFVLSKLAEALRALEPTVAPAGVSDLAFGSGAAPRKFSGNSLRKVRSRLLYHGTLLCDFDLSLIDRLLRTPPRQPDYRGGRPHGEFVRNLPCECQSLRRAIVSAWGAKTAPLAPRLGESTGRLVREKYSLDHWSLAR